MGDTAKLLVDGKTYEFPIVVGSEGERGIDISKLRDQTGLITLDVGYMNTGSCTSDITFIDGEKGILRYRGIPIEELAEKSTFVETAYLLLHGELPNKAQLSRFSSLLTQFSLIHEDMRHFFDHFPPDAHPMSMLGVMVNALSSFYGHVDAKSMTEDVDVAATRLISKIRTLAAFAYKKSIGEPIVYPRGDYTYCQNFLHMMFSSPVNHYEVNPEHVKALNMLLLMHADHEQNCSTSAVRMVGSSQANLYAAIASGVGALWGPLHGGANQSVIEMLEEIHASGMNPKQYVDKAKEKGSKQRLSGFGHRVYKNYDPRAKVLKDKCMAILSQGKDPLLDIALELEDIALHDEYFIQRKLYPNVDFYSGLLYKAMGFPANTFTVLFAIGRMPGWIAQWKEMVSAPGGKIGRPRQIYTGKTQRAYVPIAARD